MFGNLFKVYLGFIFMADKIAINTALFLPENIIDTCVTINKEALKKGKQYRNLGKNDFIPHITLSLGCVDKENIGKIKEILNKISERTKPIQLEISKIGYIKREDGNRSFFVVKHSG